MKNEIKPLHANVILKPYKVNPYLQMETAGGLLLNEDTFINTDSGQEDKLEMFIGCAEVIEVGSKALSVRVGDDVFYDTRSVRPLPFKRQGFVVIGEQNILTVMNDNLDERDV